MTEKTLQQLCEEISVTFFKRVFRHQIRYNTRLRSTGGRYLLQTGDIEINPKVETILGKEALIGVIKHELCHYHLHQEGRGYRHQDVEFQQLLKEVGGSRYVERLTPPKYIYQCPKCHQELLRMRPLNTKKYCCGRCRGPFIQLQP